MSTENQPSGDRVCLLDRLVILCSGITTRISQALERLKPPATRDSAELLRRLEWMIFIRLFITTFLLGITVFLHLHSTRGIVVHPAIPLYVLLGATFSLSLIYALALSRIKNLQMFSFFQILVDLIYITAVIHFTGGLSSVFTLLYVFPILAAAIFHFRRGALRTAFAACFFFGILISVQFLTPIPQDSWPWLDQSPVYHRGYVLWVFVVHATIFIGTAFLASSVAEQLQKVRISLSISELDYEKLSELHSSIVGSITSGIITTDKHGDIAFANDAALSILRRNRDDIINSPLKKVFPDVYESPKDLSLTLDVPDSANPASSEPRILEVDFSELKPASGDEQGRLLIFQDVTDIRKMEEQAHLSEKQAAFVRIAAGLAHEIRNPLASLRGAAELLGFSDLKRNEQEKLTRIVIREADRLNSLLTDFLSTVTSSKLKKDSMVVSDLIRETTEFFAEIAKKKSGVDVECSLVEAVIVLGEPSKLKQALWNLLNNALEALPDTGGVISVTLKANPDRSEAVLSVKDNGCGIAIDDRSRIFEPFTTTKMHGTGLGLPMTLSIVEAHGGTIEVETLPGKGTTFIVRLPTAQ
jgi:two-component system, NtrC family, sensor histidine kinase PilS